MASLILRGSGPKDSRTYYIQFIASGRANRVSTGTASLQIAKEKLRQFESAQARGVESLLPTKTPLAAVLTDYVEHIRSARTAKSAQTDLYYLRDVFGPVCETLKITSRKISAKTRKRPRKPGHDRRRKAPVIACPHFEAITTAQVSAFIAGQMASRGLSPKTGNRIRDTLSALFAWAMTQRGIVMPGGKNPVAAVTKYKASAPEISFLSLPQIDEQLDALADVPDSDRAAAGEPFHSPWSRSRLSPRAESAKMLPHFLLSARRSTLAKSRVLLPTYLGVAMALHLAASTIRGNIAIRAAAILKMIYLDCASTTPLDPRVREEVMHFMGMDFGNSGSRTHDYGVRARRAVEKARTQVAAVVAAGRGDVVFTSGATESNNLAILGLAEHGRASRRKHLVSTLVEHPSVLAPLHWLAEHGFTLTLVPPDSGGRVDHEAIRDALRVDTLLVSVMHANNETGVLQPIEAIANSLGEHPAYFHVDAAQAFCRDLAPLQNPRIDLVSISGHKIYAPKGVGALITRRRNGQRPPLSPLMHGGGQERGLRPGTLPVHLIAGLGLAAELATSESQERAHKCLAFRGRLLAALRPLHPVLNGDQARVLPHIINLTFPRLDAEDVMVALAALVAISNGSACTSQSLTCSHVLGAMGLEMDRMEGALRWSWCHMTEEPDWKRIVDILETLTRDSATASRL